MPEKQIDRQMDDGLCLLSEICGSKVVPNIIPVVRENILFHPFFSHPAHNHTPGEVPLNFFPAGSHGEGGQSGIYVLQFIFVLEAPHGLGSMLA